jgi:hypothetical protein
MNFRSLRVNLLLVCGLIAIMALVEYAMGRLPICACGYVKLWHGLVYSSGNSQHLFDWYSFSHILHGILIYFFINLFDKNKRLSVGQKFLLAVLLECSWEILENSNFIINRYRSATISFDYFGDSIINSIGDVISMSVGFLFAQTRKVWQSLVLFISIELVLLYVIRDNLTLNIIMLIHPVEAIEAWQAAGAAVPH